MSKGQSSLFFVAQREERDSGQRKTRVQVVWTQASPSTPVFICDWGKEQDLPGGHEGCVRPVNAAQVLSPCRAHSAGLSHGQEQGLLLLGAWTSPGHAGCTGRLSGAAAQGHGAV